MVWRRTVLSALALAGAMPGAARAADAPAAATTPAAAAPAAAPTPPATSPNASASIAEPEGTGPVVNLTLEDAIRLALVNNPGLQVVQGQQRQAAARIGEARAAAGPAVNATGNYVESGPIPEFTFSQGPGQPPRRVSLGSSRTRTAGVNGTFIPDVFGRIRSSVRVARFGARAATQATAATMNNLTQQVQASYHGVLRTQSLVEVSRQAVAAAQEQLRIAQAQFRAGTVPQFDVLRASVQVENDRQAQTVAESNATNALANLVNVLGIDPTTRVRVTPLPTTPLPPPLPLPAPPATNPGQPAPASPVPAPGQAPAPASAPGALTTGPAPSTTPGSPASGTGSVPSGGPASPAPLPLTEADAFSEALGRRPEVLEAQETLNQNREQIRFQRRARYPQFSLTGSYTLTPDNTGLASVDHQWQVGAGVTLNIFDAGLIRSRVREAEAGRDTAAAALAQARQSVAFDVRTALSNLRQAQLNRQTTAANVQQAQEALRIAQVRYRAGVSTSVEVTDAQVALTQAQTNQVNAEYDYLDAESALARALGRYAPPVTGRSAPPAGAAPR